MTIRFCAFVVAGIILGAPLVQAQDPMPGMRERASAAQEARAQAQALETRKTSIARRIMQERDAVTGREPFAPAFTSYWVQRLAKLSVEQLEAIAALGPSSNLAEAVVNAESANQGGAPLPTPPSGLGDSGDNLVFTKVAPCRMADTRGVGWLVAAGGLVNLKAAGATGFTAQGGNAAGCGVPIGATAVAVNVTVTQTAGAGDLRAWPYGATPATASIINYRAANTLANGVILPICDPATTTCAYDLQMTADAADTHLVVDVMGYFMKPSGLGTLKTFTIDAATSSFTYLADASACTSYSGLSVSVNAPGPGQIRVEAKLNMQVNHVAGTAEFARYGIATSPSSCSSAGFEYGSGSFVAPMATLGTGTVLVWDVATLTFTVPSAGTYTFYVNGVKETGATHSIVFNWGGMKATFNPQ